MRERATSDRDLNAHRAMRAFRRQQAADKQQQRQEPVTEENISLELAKARTHAAQESLR